MSGWQVYIFHSKIGIPLFVFALPSSISLIACRFAPSIYMPHLADRVVFVVIEAFVVRLPFEVSDVTEFVDCEDGNPILLTPTPRGYCHRQKPSEVSSSGSQGDARGRWRRWCDHDELCSCGNDNEQNAHGWDSWSPSENGLRLNNRVIPHRLG